jgi:AraC-like DNA-binding protein
MRLLHRLEAMHTVLKAVAEPHARRADRWRETVYATFSGLDIRLDRVPDERDEIILGQAGSVQVIESRSGPGQALRTARHIRQHDPGRYLLFVQSEGSDIGEQFDHCTEYRPGDLGLVDLSAPLRCTYTDRRAVMLSYPKALCPLRESEVASLAGMRIDGTSGTAALISGLVRQLPRHLETDDLAASAQVGAAVLDLLHTGLAAQLDRTGSVDAGARRRALRTRCRAFIEDHLADPDLTPAAVAAAHHISLRYLHRLFEDTGDGVAGLIRRRRLDRCRGDLLDPSLLDRPVAAVGARWGFGDPAHFNRTFKGAYGLPPAGFRQEYAYQAPATGSVTGGECIGEADC